MLPRLSTDLAASTWGRLRADVAELAPAVAIMADRTGPPKPALQIAAELAHSRRERERTVKQTLEQVRALPASFFDPEVLADAKAIADDPERMQSFMDDARAAMARWRRYTDGSS